MAETIDVTPQHETLTIAAPQAVALMTPAERVLQTATDIVVDSDFMFAEVAELLRANKGTRNEVEEQRLNLTRPIDEAKARIMDLFRKPLATRDQAEALFKSKMQGWLTHKAEVARKAAQEANDRRRKEEARVAEETARVEAEARQKAETLRQQAEAATAAGNAGQAAKLAEKAESTLSAAEAKVERIQQSSVVAPVVALPVAPKVAGVSSATLYGAECVTLAELVCYIAGVEKLARPEFVNLIEPNVQAIRAQGKAMRDAFAIPGCRLTKTSNIRASA